MCLRIFLLGQFNLKANHRPLDLPSRKAQSLFAYLAMTAGTAHRREKLAGLLWPESTDANARGYLRQALWRIRKYLARAEVACEEYLQVTDITIGFNDRANYWLDAQEFLRPAEKMSQEEIANAVDLYKGELLPGFYDDWIMPERERLQAAFHQKMSLLVDSLTRDGHWDEALQRSEEWIRLGHSPEPAFRAQMRSYSEMGDQGMVSSAYQRCISHLEQELGLGPSAETRKLYDQLILEDQAVAEAEPEQRPDTSSHRPSFLDGMEPYLADRPTFVARDHELEQLESQLSRALDGQGRVVFVTGEAGSGKTAIVQAFSRMAQEAHEGLVVTSGSCNAYTSIGDPYLPFREILAQLTGDVEARYAAGAITQTHASILWNTLPHTVNALCEVGPDLIDTFVPGSALLRRSMAAASNEAEWPSQLRQLVEVKDGDNPRQIDLFEQYTNTICYLSHTAPLVLVLDDLQWADLGSISLLFHLGRHLEASRVLVLGVYRREEVALGREGERHPLEAVINELQRNYGVKPIDLDLAQKQVFVESLIDSEPNRLDSSFKEMIFQQTRGQALFTVELLRGMQERSELVKDKDGFLVEGPNLDWDYLPVRVEAVFAERLARLAEPLQAALRAASVEGDQFTAEVIAQVRGADQGQLLGQMSSELDRRHHLIRSDSILRVNDRLLSRYRFQHVLFQRYLYNNLDEVECVHLHEQIGLALESIYGNQDSTDIGADISPQLARHFQDAGLTDKAIIYSHRAGDRAVQLSAFQEGVAHLNNSLSLLESLPPSTYRDERELEIQLSLARAMIGKIAGSEWKEAINRARELCHQLGKTTELCQVLGELSIHHYVRAEYGQAREFGEEALDLALKAQDPMLIALNNWHLGFILFGMGDYAAALNHHEELISFYSPEEHHDGYLELRASDPGPSALAYISCCKWCLGYPDQAVEQGEKALQQAQELKHPTTLADVLCYAGCILNAMMRNFGPISEKAEELLKTSEKLGFTSWQGLGLGFLGYSKAKRMYLAEGAADLQQAINQRKSKESYCYLNILICALAECLSEAGRVDEALATLAEAEMLLEQTGERHSESDIYRLKGDIYLLQEDRDLAEESYMKAIETARRRKAKSWELRAAISLAKLWKEDNKAEQAQELLAPIYEWFTEGFDTPDLIETRGLLDEISRQIERD